MANQVIPNASSAELRDVVFPWGEVVVDRDLRALRIGDGKTPGGMLISEVAVMAALVSDRLQPLVGEATAARDAALAVGDDTRAARAAVEALFTASSNALSAADRLGSVIPNAAATDLMPVNSDLGRLLFAVLDAAQTLGAGLTADGVMVAKVMRGLASVVAPLLSTGVDGKVALGARSTLAFEGDGRISDVAGTDIRLAGMNYDFVIADDANNVLLGLLGGRLHGMGWSAKVGAGRGDFDFFNGAAIKLGDHNYDVVICDPAGNVLAGWMGGTFYGPGATGDDAMLDAQDAKNKVFSRRLYERRVTTVQRPTADYVVQVVYGQSLAQGDETWPALSRTTRFGSLMLGDSVQPFHGRGTYDPIGGAGVLKPLYAITIDNSNTLYPDETTTQASGGARGEPVNHGWASGYRYALGQYLMSEDYSSRRIVSINVAVSGATIGELEKVRSEPVGGTALYNRYVNSLSKVRTIADGQGKSVVVGGIQWMQGEHDYYQASGHDSKNRTYATYRAKFTALIADMQADAIAGTGQALPPAFYCYQTGASYTRDVDADGVPGLHIGMAQLDTILASSTAWMVGPVYPVTDKGGHLDSNGSRWYGHMIAKVDHRVTVEGRQWQPLRPLRIQQRGPTTLYVSYHVPFGPLAFDQAQRNGGTVYDAPDKGFRITDASGAVAISSVDIVRDTVIRITTARAIVGEGRLWYASQAQGGNGMVRDSDPAVAIDRYVYEPERGMLATANISRFVGKPYPLWNWSVAFVLPIGYQE